MNRLVDYFITAVIILTVIVVFDKTSNASSPDLEYKAPHTLPYALGRLV